MIHLHKEGVILSKQKEIIDPNNIPASGIPELPRENNRPDLGALRKNTMASRILAQHNQSANPEKLQIKFDSLISHDITYVGIIQSARASGMHEFPVPYVLTNCHNSLCAVGGTINEDDHVFGLSAAKKYGGIYVPANQAVIHQYAREMMVSCGGMILGSDSHTRYGCYGTMGVGEGGPELVKQLLSNTYDIDTPPVILVYVENKPRYGVGPHDVALAFIKAVFESGFAKNKVLEFVGPGIENLPMDFRIGIDVMTTETTCLSSIWQTDETVRQYYEIHGRPEAYQKMQPGDLAYYEGLIRLDLAQIEPMIALPYHPANAYPIRELLENPQDILHTVEEESARIFEGGMRLNLQEKIHNGRILVDQGTIVGCSGGMYDNISAAADILDNGSIGNDYFSLSVYPASMPIGTALAQDGIVTRLQLAGVLTKSAFCGPCFGAGDVPANNGLSIRHATRNFPNRDGSKPGDGQVTGIALMDALSIAATAANGGYLTPASDLDVTIRQQEYRFNQEIYRKRVYNGYHTPKTDEALRLGPNITDWPEIHPLSENLLLVLTAVIHDPVTTTDELIPSGETSSYRSNPIKLAEFTLSRRVPGYVQAAKAVREMETERRAGNPPQSLLDTLRAVNNDPDALIPTTAIGSAVFANKPGDGSAREQAASCQKVLGGAANLAKEYATKRYRSNCINWGIVPFTIEPGSEFTYSEGDLIFVPGIREAVAQGTNTVGATVFTASGSNQLQLHISDLTDTEKQILLAGSLMNYYASQNRMKEVPANG